MIVVHMDEDHVVAGKPATGSVHLRLTKKFQAESLYLEVKGKEVVQWTQKMTRTDVVGGKNKTVKYTELTKKE